jgi:methionine-rich copper-binding protein CopC
VRALTAPRLAGVLALAALWHTVCCTPAFAHARLVQERPASGVSLAEPPEQVRLRFNEPVDAEFDPVKVYDAEGDRVDEDDARVDPDDARVLLAGLEDLPEGSYRVEWRVTSIDGHVIEDAYAFNVTPDAGDTGGGSRAGAEDAGERGAQATAGEDPAAGSSGGLDRSVLYSILTFGVLGLVVLALVAASWLRRRRSRGVR